MDGLDQLVSLWLPVHGILRLMVLALAFHRKASPMCLREQNFGGKRIPVLQQSDDNKCNLKICFSLLLLGETKCFTGQKERPFVISLLDSG